MYVSGWFFLLQTVQGGSISKHGEKGSFFSSGRTEGTNESWLHFSSLHAKEEEDEEESSLETDDSAKEKKRNLFSTYLRSALPSSSFLLPPVKLGEGKRKNSYLFPSSSASSFRLVVVEGGADGVSPFSWRTSIPPKRAPRILQFPIVCVVVVVVVVSFRAPETTLWCSTCRAQNWILFACKRETLKAFSPLIKKALLKKSRVFETMANVVGSYYSGTRGCLVKVPFIWS